MNIESKLLKLARKFLVKEIDVTMDCSLYLTIHKKYEQEIISAAYFVEQYYDSRAVR